MDDLKEFIEQYWKWIIGGLFIVIIILLLFILLKPSETVSDKGTISYEDLINESEVTEVSLEDDSENHLNTKEEEISSIIIIDLKGAVDQPGVYEMLHGSRLIDAIDKAGGFTDEADRNSVNLAQVLSDQMVIYVAEIGEETAVPDSISDSENLEGNSTLININNAEMTELMELKGIGEAKAQNIVGYREENGRFSSIEEIKEVSGIGDGIFEGIKENITIE